MAQQPLVDQALLIIEASRSHSDTPHAIGLLCTSDRPDADNTQHSQEADINAPSRIRTRNPSKWMAADPGLRQRGHWDRQELLVVKGNFFPSSCVNEPNLRCKPWTAQIHRAVAYLQRTSNGEVPGPLILRSPPARSTFMYLFVCV
jgi:hypothetical protein